MRMIRKINIFPKIVGEFQRKVNETEFHFILNTK